MLLLSSSISAATFTRVLCCCCVSLILCCAVVVQHCFCTTTVARVLRCYSLIMRVCCVVAVYHYVTLQQLLARCVYSALFAIANSLVHPCRKRNCFYWLVIDDAGGEGTGMSETRTQSHAYSLHGALRGHILGCRLG